MADRPSSRCPMIAARIRRFGQPSVITIDDLLRRQPGAAELLIRVKAAGVGQV